MTLRYNLKGYESDGLFRSIEEMYDYFQWLDNDLLTSLKQEVDIDNTEYIMRNIPDEFKPVLSMRAYESGHSSGENEVIGILRGLVSDFEKPIQDYTNRIKRLNETN